MNATATTPEVKAVFYVWRFKGQEISAYRTLNQAEAHLRRTMKAGWGENSMYLLDKDGELLFAGTRKTGHTIRPEERNVITGV